MHGTPGFRMPAFSPAIAASVLPRNETWSMEIGVIAVGQRLLDDIGRVEPAAKPGLQQQQIGGVSAKARKAAAVVISK